MRKPSETQNVDVQEQRREVAVQVNSEASRVERSLRGSLQVKEEKGLSWFFWLAAAHYWLGETSCNCLGSASVQIRDSLMVIQRSGRVHR